MKKEQQKIIELKEYAHALFTREDISYEAGEALWRNYKAQVDVEFPSPKTDWLRVSDSNSQPFHTWSVGSLGSTLSSSRLYQFQRWTRR